MPAGSLEIVIFEQPLNAPLPKEVRLEGSTDNYKLALSSKVKAPIRSIPSDKVTVYKYLLYLKARLPILRIVLGR
jgi:hypothetical protein